MLPEVDPGPDSTYFWAHQFRLEGGEGGYIGLQTKGNRADGSLGKMAIFSIWDALGADGMGTVRFGGEGTGWSCRIPYLWEAGRAYRLRVASDRPGWWDAAVTDSVTGATSWIGRIQVPEGWGGLGSWSVMWTEYYGGPIRRCEELPHSRVVFGFPVADDGAIAPDTHENRYNDGTCENSNIEMVDTDLRGVRHEIGGPGR
ncbi:MAG TPA: DUF3472 domain-containing protein [Acidimicrobiales bacterium]|nr:DUF3472 domain-containing protein [Acidimicrobiales bacterium]